MKSPKKVFAYEADALKKQEIGQADERISEQMEDITITEELSDISVYSESLVDKKV